MARREALGLSLSQVARRAGTSVATLSRYEHGWTRFEVQTLQKLADALGCELDIALRPRTCRTPKPVSPAAVVARIKRLFWDHTLGQADLRDRPIWVVERVLEYGDLDDINALVAVMGHAPFVKAVAQADRVSPLTRNFWRQVLDMEGVPCTKRYSRNTAWIS
jgi:transcriptional regulator with XRE-family HTH domain